MTVRVFVFRHVLADLAGLDLHDRDALDAANGPFTNFGDAFAAEAFDDLGLAFRLVDGPLDLVGFGHAFANLNGAGTGGGTSWRTIIGPRG